MLSAVGELQQNKVFDFTLCAITVATDRDPSVLVHAGSQKRLVVEGLSSNFPTEIRGLTVCFVLMWVDSLSIGSYPLSH